ncbi:MAG: hypothetical protein HKN20_11705, partial [Gemmatimonadetes bacterium]|nr:hypothetical protein [Gemmatimonadota bacterium]
GGERYSTRVVEYWPHLLEEWKEGPDGAPVAGVVVADNNGTRQEVLQAGDSVQGGSASIHFTGIGEAAPVTGAGLGELIVEHEGKRHRLAVTPDLVANAGPYEIAVTEFHGSFRVGKEPDPNEELVNPAVRLAVTGPDGAMSERLLFAFHPDFNAIHNQQSAAGPEINYVLRQNLWLAMDASGAATAWADFPLTVVEADASGHASGEKKSIAAGAPFPLNPKDLVSGSGFSFMATELWPSATISQSQSTDTRLPAAVKVRVEGRDGTSAESVLVRGVGGTGITVGDAELTVAYKPIRINVPYEVHLDDFLLITYPGSENPASFESHVRVFDRERGIDGMPVRIYMNHPLTYRGFKHFQSSYDQDRLGTVLSVNHDPGKWPTYVGYAMMTLGFLITLTRSLWYRPRALAAAVIAVGAIALAGSPQSALAQAPEEGGGTPA